MKRTNLMAGAGLLALFVLGSMMAQQFSSGGAAVTLQAGAAIAGKFGIDQTTPGTTNAVSLAQIGATTTATGNGVVGAGVQRVSIASDNTAFAVNATLAAAIPAGSNIIGTVNTIPKTACGNTLATGSTLAAVPTSSTLLTSAATACAVAATFFNTNASAVTVVLSDNTATPINAILTFSIPGNSNIVVPLFGGAFNLGIKWSASGAGVTGFVVAYQ